MVVEVEEGVVVVVVEVVEGAVAMDCDTGRKFERNISGLKNPASFAAADVGGGTTVGGAAGLAY